MCIPLTARADEMAKWKANLYSPSGHPASLPRFVYRTAPFEEGGGNDVQSRLCKKFSLYPFGAQELVGVAEHCGYQMAGLTAYPASATEQTIRPEFDIDDGEESKRGRQRSLRLMHYMKRLEDNAPKEQADGKEGGEQPPRQRRRVQE